MKKFPKELLVYVCDYDDGKPIYAVAENVADIPEQLAEPRVGVYVLNRTCKYAVKRELL
jgi:hypothetical protein